MRGLCGRFPSSFFAIAATVTAVGGMVADAAKAQGGGGQPDARVHAIAGSAASVAVLLPAAYETLPDTSFRVLYVLPVEPRGTSTYGDPLAVIQSLGLHDTYRLICVAVQFDETSWLGDHATDDRRRHATCMVETVVPHVDGHCRTVKSAEGRLLLGFSKSGWAAITLLLRHGDTFGAAASWDAPLMLTGEQFGIYETDVHYGTAAAMAAQSPTALLRRRAGEFHGRPRLVIAGSNLFGTFGEKRFPYDGPPHTEAFHDLAEKLRVPHVYEPRIRAEHSWNGNWLGPVVERLVELSPVTEEHAP